MKKIFILIFVSFVLLFFTQKAISQDKADDKKLAVAINSYNNLKFIQAIEELKPVLAKDPTNVDATEIMANSYRLTKQYKEALVWYEKLSKLRFSKPDWNLHYAEALANNKEYEKSEQFYRKYLAMIPSDRRAKLFSEADFDKLGKTVDWDIKFLNINTLASDYSPMLYKDGLLFTSNRQNTKPVKYVFGWNNTPFSDLYLVKDKNNIKPIEETQDTVAEKGVAKKKKSKYNDDNTKPTSNDSEILGVYDSKTYSVNSDDNKNVKVEKLTGNVNTKFHEGAPAQLPNGDIIFTRNNYYKSKAEQSSDGTTKLKMFTAKGYNLNEIVPFNYNNDEYSVGHPTVSKDGGILIFSSDMPNGLGGVDLYYCIRLSDKGEWSRPVNFGKKINSEGDEEFPYLDNFNKLYFSSNGLPGLGGLDVFSIEIKDLKPIGIAENLGPPLNSPFDDFAVAKINGESGYFSSNRRGNDDIYSFKRKEYKIILEAKVVDGATGLPLINSIVTLRDGDNIQNIPLDANAGFIKELPKNTGFDLIGTLKDFLPDRRYIGTDGITQDTVIKVTLTLNKANAVQQFVFKNCDSLKRVFKTENIYYDLDKYFIRADAEPSLDKLANLLKRYPYLKVLTSSHCDSRASENYNRILSLNRGESAKAYLIAKGIGGDRISVGYYGKSRLVNKCVDGVECSEDEQQRNRRTEFEIIYNGINLNQIDCK